MRIWLVLCVIGLIAFLPSCNKSSSSGSASANAASATPLDPSTLIGTKWVVGDMHVAFRDASTVVVTGGKASEVAPDGLECSYSVKDNIIEVDAMGDIRRGLWDGKTFVIDGKPAVKEQ